MADITTLSNQLEKHEMIMRAAKDDYMGLLSAVRLMRPTTVSRHMDSTRSLEVTFYFDAICI